MFTLTIVWLSGEVTAREFNAEEIVIEVKTLTDFAHTIKSFTVTPVR